MAVSRAVSKPTEREASLTGTEKLTRAREAWER